MSNKVQKIIWAIGIVIVLIGIISISIIITNKENTKLAQAQAQVEENAQTQQGEEEIQAENIEQKIELNKAQEAIVNGSKTETKEEKNEADTKINKEEVKEEASLKNEENAIEKEEKTEVLNSTKNSKLQLKNSASVYASANTSKKIGSVSQDERVIELAKENGFVKVRYSGIGGSKTGYIATDNLKLASTIPENFNNFSVPSNVTKSTYGESGNGRPLYYYKVGNGKKILLLNFAIHGYEDAWVQDSYELTKIAKYTLDNLAKRDKNQGLNGWTVYIIPSANPDGLLDGYTNDGPGRAQVSKGIDVNRDFPANFKVYNTARNKTGNSPLASPEARELASFVKTLKNKTGNLVVVDVHGWLNESYGDSSVSKYFDSAYGFANKPITKFDGGYLAGYAKSIGARASLVELPNPVTPANIQKNQYAQKMAKAVNNLIDNFKF